MNTSPLHRADSNVRQAEEPAEVFPKIESQQAVVIGIDHYPAGFRALNNAVNDARAVSQILRDEYGFTLLPNGEALLETDATLNAIQRTIERSLRAAEHRLTRWLFYFAGHGVAVDGKGYLAPVDAQNKKDISVLLPLDWLLDACRKSLCAETLIILDACFSGRALLQPETLTDLIPAQADQSNRARLIVTSGNPDQPVLDGGGSGHSIFTQLLLEALGGWAGIHDKNGSIRFMRLLDYLALDVPIRLQGMGLNAASQQPIGGYFGGNRRRRDFIFEARAPRLDPELVRAARSDDAQTRKNSMMRLPASVENNPTLGPLAVELARKYLVKASGSSPSLMTSTLGIEPVVENRAAAVMALGNLRQPTAIPYVVEALNDEKDVCYAAIQALSMIGAPESVSFLVERLDKIQDDMFIHLSDAIGKLGGTVEMVQTLQEALRGGRLVPFIGPDLPQELTGVKSRSEFRDGLAQNNIKPSSLAQVAEIITQNGQKHHSLIQALKDAYDHPFRSPGSFYDVLKRLTPPFWLSGCYDNFLAQTIGAKEVVMGEDTKYQHANRPTVVRLFGDPSSIRGVVVLEKEYELLRENENDRKLLIDFLRQKLQGKILLCIGFDPSSEDFFLLNRYLFNQHFSGLGLCIFLVWPVEIPKAEGGEYLIHQIRYDHLELFKKLLEES